MQMFDKFSPIRARLHQMRHTTDLVQKLVCLDKAGVLGGGYAVETCIILDCRDNGQVGLDVAHGNNHNFIITL